MAFWLECKSHKGIRRQRDKTYDFRMGQIPLLTSRKEERISPILVLEEKVDG